MSSGQIAWRNTCTGFQRVASAGIEDILAVVLDEERDDRGVAAPAFGDLAAKEIGLGAAEFPAALLHLRIIIEPRQVVVPR